MKPQAIEDVALDRLLHDFVVNLLRVLGGTGNPDFLRQHLIVLSSIVGIERDPLMQFGGGKLVELLCSSRWPGDRREHMVDFALRLRAAVLDSNATQRSIVGHDFDRAVAQYIDAERERRKR
jgi:hypothetical protein